MIIQPLITILPYHVNGKDEYRRSKTWQRVLPQVGEERMAPPCVLSLEWHIVCCFVVYYGGILSVGGRNGDQEEGNIETSEIRDAINNLRNTIKKKVTKYRQTQLIHYYAVHPPCTQSKI